MEHCEAQQRAFYRRQADRLLELAQGAGDPGTAEELSRAARYYLDKLTTPDPTAVAA